MKYPELSVDPKGVLKRYKEPLGPKGYSSFVSAIAKEVSFFSNRLGLSLPVKSYIYSYGIRYLEFVFRLPGGIFIRISSGGRFFRPHLGKAVFNRVSYTANPCMLTSPLLSLVLEFENGLEAENIIPGLSAASPFFFKDIPFRVDDTSGVPPTSPKFSFHRRALAHAAVNFSGSLNLDETLENMGFHSAHEVALLISEVS